MYQDPYQQPPNQPSNQQPPYGQPNSGLPPTYYGPGGQPSPYDQSPYGQPPQYGQQPGVVPPVPYGTPPQYSPPPQKKSNTLWIVLGVIGLLVILSCIGCSIFGAGLGKGIQSSQNNQQATATATTPSVDPTVAAQQQLYDQSTGGTPILSDPLDGSNTDNWSNQTSNKTNATCKFTNGKFHIKEPSKDYFIHCLGPDTAYKNFALQVEMTIISGEKGGIIFRYDDASPQFYYLSLGQDGSYDLSTFKGNDNGKTVAKGMNQDSFHTGLNQANVITIIAKGTDMYLYINKNYVTHFTESSYSSGQLGLAADVSSEVAFSQIKVWSL